PCAILIVTGCIGANAWRVFEAMGAGALDAVDTPRLGEGAAGDTARLLLAKIDQIGRLLDAPGGVRTAGTTTRASGGPL
ncbi:chemotaxis response regulator protein-glutamate methylesterase, partial [Pseudomonas sp. SIMBA_064]